MVAKVTKRIAIPVEFPQAHSDSVMDRLSELEGVFGIQFQGQSSAAHGDDVVTGVILTVPRNMSERLAVRMVRMVLGEHGLSTVTGKQYKVPEPG